MNSQTSSSPSTNTSAAAGTFKDKLTKKGKPRARYTMKCVFIEAGKHGNEFTYRDDDELVKLKAKGYKNICSLDALVIRFTSVKKLSESIEIFDNAMPKGEDRKVHYLAGRVMLNELFIPGTKIKYVL